VTQTSDTKSQTEQPESAAPSRQPRRKSILALSVFALGLNATAAAYTLSPSDFALPNVGSLAELLPRQKASDSITDPVVAALKDIQSAQQQHTALLQLDSIELASLRQGVMDEQVDVKKVSAQIANEHEDVKKISAQISSLIAKVDSLQNAITPAVTSSIPTGHARNRLSREVRKRQARQPKPLGPISVGGVPLSFPAITPGPQG
jgi:septal ring factor EnvC (AmiA/AmiB activator)